MNRVSSAPLIHLGLLIALSFLIWLHSTKNLKLLLLQIFRLYNKSNISFHKIDHIVLLNYTYYPLDLQKNALYFCLHLQEI